MVGWIIAAALAVVLIVVVVRDRQKAPAIEASAFADDEALLRGLVEDRLAAAERLVDAYGTVLDHHSPVVVHPDTVLPASRKDIKVAVLQIAALRKIRRQLTPDVLASFRTSYALLSNFVPADEAQRANTMFDAAAEYQNSDRSRESILRAAKRIVASNDAFGEQAARTHQEHVQLLVEFDQRFAAMSAVMAQAEPAV